MKNQKFTFTLFLVIILMSSSCKVNQDQTQVKNVVSNENLVMATLYYQRAAEMKALALQAYNIARMRLDQELAQTQEPSKLAIVLDIDETVLDNSPYEAKSILENMNYPTGWDEWIFKAAAEPLPGVVEFLSYADSKKVQIFYITNRRDKYREATVKNLIEKGLPQTGESHLMFRTAESSKEARRLQVLQNQQIILLIGDNLGDFDKLFDDQPMEKRSAMVDSLKLEFGKRFIILPNPMYGDWLQAIYNYDNKLTPEQKQEINYKMLKGY
jgi:5'-nucleotidase (lipoprotein e(P4) family)